MRKLVFFIFLLVLSSKALLAQDRHFSQFYAAPIFLNPALTGSFEGNFRLGLNYRDQWRRTLDNPFVTNSGFVDIKLKVPISAGYEDYIGIGVLFFADKVPEVDFNTNQFAISGAFHKALDYTSKQYLSLGFQLGLNSRNINYEKLTFADQFNGISGYTESTNESFPRNTFAFADLALGLNYQVSLAKNGQINAGLAMHHILEPNIAFDQTADKIPLNRKYTVYAGGEFPLNNSLSILPRAFVMLQDQHFETTVGTNFRYLANDYSSIAFHFGGWLRVARDIKSSVRPDAFILLAGLEFNRILLGLSYDINLGSFAQSGLGRQSFELSVGYLGEHEEDGVVCPKF